MTNNEPNFRIHRDRAPQPDPVPTPEPLVDDGVEEDLEVEVPTGYDWRGVILFGMILVFIGYLCWLYR